MVNILYQQTEDNITYTEHEIREKCTIESGYFIISTSEGSQTPIKIIRNLCIAFAPGTFVYEVVIEKSNAALWKLVKERYHINDKADNSPYLYCNEKRIYNYKHVQDLKAQYNNGIDTIKTAFDKPDKNVNLMLYKLVLTKPLVITPPSLTVPKYMDIKTRTVTYNFILENTTERPIVFKFKTNEPTKYSVRPRHGVIRPKFYQSISIAFSASTASTKNDRFRILYGHDTDDLSMKVGMHCIEPEKCHDTFTVNVDDKTTLITPNLPSYLTFHNILSNVQVERVNEDNKHHYLANGNVGEDVQKYIQSTKKYKEIADNLNQRVLKYERSPLYRLFMETGNRNQILQNLDYNEIVVILDQLKDATQFVGNALVEKLLSSCQCCICMENEKTELFMPCRHLCCCKECTMTIQAKQKNACPICRQTIEQVISVHN